MENKHYKRYPSNSIEYFYKYSNNNIPKSSIEQEEAESPNSTRYETKTKKNIKVGQQTKMKCI